MASIVSVLLISDISFHQTKIGEIIYSAFLMSSSGQGWPFRMPHPPFLKFIFKIVLYLLNFKVF